MANSSVQDAQQSDGEGAMKCEETSVGVRPSAEKRFLPTLPSVWGIFAWVEEVTQAIIRVEHHGFASACGHRIKCS